MPNPGCQVSPVYLCRLHIYVSLTFFSLHKLFRRFFLFSLFLKLVAKGGEEWCACVHASFLMFMENRQGGLCQKYYDERVGECVRSDD